MAKKQKPMFTSAEWTFDNIRRVYDEIQKIAEEELKLTYYPNQIEIISSEQMIDAYTSVGLPIMYTHWSFGKRFVDEYGRYRKGLGGLAYEIVINSNPCISYCMEENSMTMQTLVIAHAAFGHNFFFKNNYLFKDWTDASSIIPYLTFAKKYISECEERYGETVVEKLLNSCHALQSHGVDRYKRPAKLSIHEEKSLQADRQEFLRTHVDHLWERISNSKGSCDEIKKELVGNGEENILYFLEKYSPILEPWQREILRIVRRVAQYFYPQAQTKVMNEGTATYVHYYIMNRLYDKGLITDGQMKEFLISHTDVVFQAKFDDVVIYKDPKTGEEKIYSRYNGINPYALGFDMFRDIQRICETPTKEDKYYFPNICGERFIDVFHDAVNNYRDESFIRQFLSPELVRKWGMFVTEDDSDRDEYLITATQNDSGFEEVRNSLAEKHTISNFHPEIKVSDVDLKGNRTLNLTHTVYNGIQLNEDNMADMIKHLWRLWGHEVVIESRDGKDNSPISEYSIDEPEEGDAL